MYEKERAKADVLIEAIPYIRKFAGTTVVVKYGGSAMVDEKLKKSVIKDIALLKYIGLKPVVVHGGGKEITALLDRLGKETQFVDGLRVTDAETAGVAEMVLSGSIGKSLVENLESVGVEACGINGKDGHTLQARKKVDEKVYMAEKRSMPIVYRFYEDRLEVSTSTGDRSSTMYHDLYTVYEVDTAFYIMFDKNTVCIIPKSKCPEGMEDFIRDLGRKKQEWLDSQQS